MPHHLLVREEGSDEVLGCCPLYLKVLDFQPPLIRLISINKIMNFRAALNTGIYR